MASSLNERLANDRLEEEVRVIAKQLFPGNSTSMGRFLDERERDGVFDDGEAFHIFEVTVSKRKDKIESDISKSAKLASELRKVHSGHNVKIWIVTLEPPTVEQEAAAYLGRKKARCPVEILSYAALYTKLFDAKAFLESRLNYPFGSIRDPFSNAHTVPDSVYVDVGFTLQGSDKVIKTKEILNGIVKGGFRGVLLGDYGAGKSMALRHIYKLASEEFKTGKVRRFPIYLNLRDHFGQSDPSESLMRHAGKVGVEFTRLIAAWRAGFADVFLDGFDELSPAQFVTEARNLRAARRAAAELVQRFIEESRNESSILVSGRRHYFDSNPEMLAGLGLENDANIFHIGDFNSDQINELLAKLGLEASIPMWMPRRPLLIGYLAANRLLDRLGDLDLISPSEGWDYLLTRICDREVKQIQGSPVEPGTLRVLLERLATAARSMEGGRGPIAAGDIIATFESILNQPADDRTRTLLLRLPGLATVPGQSDAREFIDEDFVDACRAGDSRRFIISPFEDGFDYSGLQIEGGNVLIDFLRRDFESLSQKQIASALEAASRRRFDIFGLDIAKGMMLAGVEYNSGNCSIRDAYIMELDVFSDLNFSGLTFKDCWIREMTIGLSDDGLVSDRLPKFEDCIIENLYGLAQRGDIPKSNFLGSTFVENVFGIGITNAEILTSDEIPVPIAVLITILKKSFFQAGGGRQEAAFFRGLDHRAKSYVHDILRILEREGFIEKSGRAGPTVWLAQKDRLAEAKQMRDAPMSTNCEVLRSVRALIN